MAGNYLFVTTNEAEIVCLDRRDGSVLWMTQLDLFENPNKRRDRIAWTGPVLAGGRVFVASSNGQGAVLNAYDGEVLREMEERGLVRERMLWAQIEKLVALTTLAIQPELALRYRERFPRAWTYETASEADPNEPLDERLSPIAESAAGTG